MTSVGVVIPAHRLDSWLDEAAESVLASRDVDVELVVVVNGVSTLADRAWQSDSRVTLVHEQSALGPTKAMILGIRRTSAEFIARLDADDRMLPARLAAQVAYLRAHLNAPMVGTATRRITAAGAPAGSIRMPTGDDVRAHLVLYNPVPHSSVMLRRTCLDAVGGYDPALSQMEDYDLFLRLARLGPIPVLAAELTEYRLHSGQISRGARPSGEHIDRIVRERTRLGRQLGMSSLTIGGRNLVWRAVQYMRYYGVTRPGHEY